MEAPNPWRTTPRRSRLIFLLAVFFVFATIGLSNDIMAMGQQPRLRFALSVFASGAFAVCYAVSGITLRGKFWKALIPLLIAQFSLMAFLGRRIPAQQELTQFNPAETERLSERLVFDAVAIIVMVSLGYVAFVYVFISEGRRYVKTEREKAVLEGEMAAAREVQRLMIPEKMPPIPGFSLESVYYPAMEVGGDFFQIIPLRSGRTLVAIGDVSGKGLGAAMMVSMIVGALHSSAAATEDPAHILGDLNQRLLESTYDGFATCLAVRLDQGGALSVANAGHLPPYLNGTEVTFAGSTPLGLIKGAVCEAMHLQMSESDVFVLLTDGIAEAQDERRNLLGFARIESLLREGTSARGLADAARQHGQTDDFTVIRIMRGD